MKKVKPIKPEQVNSDSKSSSFPDEVIEAFNELIVKNMRNNSSMIYQKDVVNLIASKLSISKQKVYDEEYLDVESLYEKQGWKVYYDKPGYCEDYEPTFTFSKK